MKKRTIIAKFTGKDRSLGYVNGRAYKLIIHEFDWFHRLINRWSIEVKKEDGTGFCPYKSLFEFLDNWKVLEVK